MEVSDILHENRGKTRNFVVVVVVVAADQGILLRTNQRENLDQKTKEHTSPDPEKKMVITVHDITVTQLSDQSTDTHHHTEVDQVIDPPVTLTSAVLPIITAPPINIVAVPLINITASPLINITAAHGTNILQLLKLPEKPAPGSKFCPALILREANCLHPCFHEAPQRTKMISKKKLKNESQNLKIPKRHVLVLKRFPNQENLVLKTRVLLAVVEW